jgi:hypothetical protein
VTAKSVHEAQDELSHLISRQVAVYSPGKPRPQIARHRRPWAQAEHPAPFLFLSGLDVWEESDALSPQAVPFFEPPRVAQPLRSPAGELASRCLLQGIGLQGQLHPQVVQHRPEDLLATSRCGVADGWQPLPASVFVGKLGESCVLYAQQAGLFQVWLGYTPTSAQVFQRPVLQQVYHGPSAFLIPRP